MKTRRILLAGLVIILMNLTSCLVVEHRHGYGNYGGHYRHHYHGHHYHYR